MLALPRKLKRDAIVEALVEFRFQHAELPEVAFARLMDLPRWKGFQVTRLPASNIPFEARAQDPNLFFQATAQLDSPSTTLSCRIGPNVLSIHNAKTYLGWDAGFREIVESVAKDLFSALPSAIITRLGLRYINIFSKVKHGIESPLDLKIKLDAGGQSLNNSFHLTFSQVKEFAFEVKAQIASMDVVTGNVPDDGSVLFDIDVFTPESLGKILNQDVISWIDKAHHIEKEVFFSILPDGKIEELREE